MKTLECPFKGVDTICYKFTATTKLVSIVNRPCGDHMDRCSACKRIVCFRHYEYYNWCEVPFIPKVCHECIANNMTFTIDGDVYNTTMYDCISEKLKQIHCTFTKRAF